MLLHALLQQEDALLLHNPKLTATVANCQELQYHLSSAAGLHRRQHMLAVTADKIVTATYSEAQSQELVSTLSGRRILILRNMPA